MDVQKHLEKAKEAARKKNFDYAVQLLQQVLLLQPDHGEARAELRRVLERRMEVKRTPPLFGFLQGLPHRVAAWIGVVARKPELTAQAAERALVHAPRDRWLLRVLADALEKAGHLDSAVAVWESLADDERLGDEALKRAGYLHYRRKRMEQALACFEKVLERSPRDGEAEKMRKNLAAEGVLSSGSYDPTRSSRELMRDADRARELEIAQKIVTTDDEAKLLRERLEAKVREDPADRRARRALVDHLVKTRDFDAALAELERAVSEDPETLEWRDRLGDVRIARLDHEIREARKRAEAGDPAARTDLVDLQREKREVEIEEVRRRVREHPTDLELRYRLGTLLLEEGELEEAIEAFQHAVKDPRRKVDALLGLGRAFSRQGLSDLARKQLKQALGGVEPSSERAVEIRYELGLLAEGAGDLDEALEHFEGIYERDIHYRDVAARVLELRRRREAAGAPPERGAERSGGKPAEGDRSSGGQTGLYDFKD